MKYFRVWKQLTVCAFSSYASNRIEMGSFLAGKVVRFIFFWFFVVSLFNFTGTLAGYTKYEVLFFFLTFNFVDVLSQIFLRGFYVFQQDIKKGNFDFLLTKPISPLFYSMSRLNDMMDLIFFVPIAGLLIYIFPHLDVPITLVAVLSYVAFIILSQLLLTSIHILFAALSVRTVESENVLWAYRELMTLGRLPPDILPGAMQFIFTFVIPIIIAVAYPVKVYLGLLTPLSIVTAIIVSIAFFGVSLVFWNRSLRYYSSASS